MKKYHNSDIIFTMSLELPRETAPGSAIDYLPQNIRESRKWKPLRDNPLHFALLPFAKMLDAYPKAVVFEKFNYENDTSTVCCQLTPDSLIRITQPPALAPDETAWLNPELDKINSEHSVFHVSSTQIDLKRGRINRVIIGSHFLVFIADSDNPFRFYSTTILCEGLTDRNQLKIIASTPEKTVLTEINKLQDRKILLISPDMTTAMISQEESYPVGIAQRSLKDLISKGTDSIKKTKAFIDEHGAGELVGPLVNRLYYELGIRIPATDLGFHKNDPTGIFKQTQQLIIDKTIGNLAAGY
jgi:hypothetical protein